MTDWNRVMEIEAECIEKANAHDDDDTHAGYTTSLCMAAQRIAELEAKARDITCVYCGHHYGPTPLGTQHEILTAHIAECKEHPLYQARQRIAELAVDKETVAMAHAIFNAAGLRGGPYDTEPLTLPERCTWIVRRLFIRSEDATKAEQRIAALEKLLTEAVSHADGVGLDPWWHRWLNEVEKALKGKGEQG